MFLGQLYVCHLSEKKNIGYRTFLSGTIFGAYLAQNYDIPNIEKSSNIFINYLKTLEKDDK